MHDVFKKEICLFKYIAHFGCNSCTINLTVSFVANCIYLKGQNNLIQCIRQIKDISYFD